MEKRSRSSNNRTNYKEESLNLKSQFVTSSLEIKSESGGRRKLPLVFTEQGIIMI